MERTDDLWTAIRRVLPHADELAASVAAELGEPVEDVHPSVLIGTIALNGQLGPEAAAIAAWAKGALRQAVVEGPLALDLILSRQAAAVKGVDSRVAGRADIILVPEINSGNALVKLMALGMGACAAGVVMGARVPILLTSRSQQAPDRIASAALGAILAADQTTPSAAAERHEGAMRIAAAMMSLPEAQRRALELRYIRGLPVAEIGRELGRTPVAVAGLIKRGTQALREVLAERG